MGMCMSSLQNARRLQHLAVATIELGKKAWVTRRIRKIDHAQVWHGHSTTVFELSIRNRAKLMFHDETVNLVATQSVVDSSAGLAPWRVCVYIQGQIE